jgi:hypothetical protein
MPYRPAVLIAVLALGACANPLPAPPAVPAADAVAVAGADAGPIGFTGFGPAAFGANEEAVRIAWGPPGLKGGRPAPGSTCYHLAMDPPPEGARGIRFMLEEGRFVRYEVDVDRWTAPGDLRVGDPLAKARVAHAGHIEERPHKYVVGALELIVRPAGGGPTRLVLEGDTTGRIVSWRIGVPPQVFYVEGCG